MSLPALTLVKVPTLMPLLLPSTLPPPPPLLALVLSPVLVPEPLPLLVVLLLPLLALPLPVPRLVLAVRLPSRSGRFRSFPSGTAAAALLLGPGATPPAALKDSAASWEAAWTQAWWGFDLRLASCSLMCWRMWIRRGCGAHGNSRMLLVRPAWVGLLWKSSVAGISAGHAPLCSAQVTW